MNPRLVISYLLFWVGDLWSKTSLFQTYGYGYGFYSKAMDWSSKLDDKGVIWKRPQPQAVTKAIRRKRKLLMRKH